MPAAKLETRSPKPETSSNVRTSGKPQTQPFRSLASSARFGFRVSCFGFASDGTQKDTVWTRFGTRFE